MEKMEEIKQEWEKMMESVHKMQGMMQDMDMEGMEDMKMEWDKMMGSIDKMKGMMMQKGM